MSYLFLKHSLGSAKIVRLSGKTIIGSALGFMLALAQPVAAQQSRPANTTHAVVELFTSQGCASCPPADALMCNYASNSDIVVLTMPVTCWDYLGWRDTLANEKFTARQRTYAKMRGARRIYTPQAIINGEMHLLGSDANAMQKALDNMSSVPDHGLPLTVNILPHGEGFRVQIIPSILQPAGKATVLLVPFHREQTVAIEGGENKGRSLSYVNVVHDLVPLAPLPDATSPEEPIMLSLHQTEAMPDKTNGFAILVQRGNTTEPGRILGAAAFISDDLQPTF